MWIGQEGEEYRAKLNSVRTKNEWQVCEILIFTKYTVQFRGCPGDSATGVWIGGNFDSGLKFCNSI